MALLGAVGVRTDPILSHNFVISLLDDKSDTKSIVKSAAISAALDVALGGFSECSGVEMSLEIEKYQEGGNNGKELIFPSRITWSNITLKKGVGAGTGLWEWFQGFLDGNGQRKNGVIALMTQVDRVPVPNNIWYFERGLPVKYTGPSMNAMQSNVAIESIEISHEGVKQIQYKGAGFGVIPAAVNTGLNLLR